MWKNNRVRLAGVSLLALGLAVYLLNRGVEYAYVPVAQPATFEEFYEAQLSASRAAGAVEGTEERLVRNVPGRAREAILYIHGFGASRVEGEAVVDRIAAERQANVYYLRLPGHGLDMEAHAKATYKDYLDACETALAMMPLLGERVIVVGTSTGGLLATYLAAEHPDRVHALILASPLYDYAAAASNLLKVPGSRWIVKAAYGDVREISWAEDPEDRYADGVEKYWTAPQKYEALFKLEELRSFVAQDNTYERVRAPTLLLYYYKDEAHKDASVSVEAMLEAFAQFGKLVGASPLNRAVAVADGNHVLLSQYVRTDKEFILREMRSFFAALDAEHETN